MAKSAVPRPRAEKQAPAPGRFRAYVQHIAQVRYVIRKVQRIIDESAKTYGFLPLEYQALIQVLGASAELLPIGQVAERLDIVPSLASRLIAKLDKSGYVRCARDQKDRRTTYVRATEAGARVVFDVVRDAQRDVEYFQSGLSRLEREMALKTLSFYVKLPRNALKAPPRRPAAPAARPRTNRTARAQ